MAAKKNKIDAVPLDIHQIVHGKIQNDRTEFGTPQDLELIASIRQHGLLQPITVRPIEWADYCTLIGPGQKVNVSKPVYELVAGERRTRACWGAGLTEVPAVIRQLTDEQTLDLMLIENVNRSDLGPFDEARAYQRRLDSGFTLEEVAKKASRPETRVRLYVKLLGVADDLRWMVPKHIPVDQAALLADLPHDVQRALSKMYTKRPLTAQELRFAIDKVRQQDQQESMFDMAGLLVEQVEKGKVFSGKNAQVDVIDLPGIPEPQSGKGDTVGTIAHRYMLSLQRAGMFKEASAVGKLYRSLVKANLCSVGTNIFDEVPDVAK